LITFRLFYLISLLLLLLQSAQAQLFDCNGVWQNKPCADVPAAILLESSDTNSNLEPKSKTNLKDLEPATSIKSRSTDKKLVSKRCPNLKRDKPKVSVSQDKKVNSRVKITAKISGKGPVKISGKWFWQRHGSDKVNSNLLSSKQVRLPDSGGNASVSWQFRYPPIAASWWWGIDAENAEPWAGNYDLRGCCSARKGSSEPRCLADGGVRCGDGKRSERCLCLKSCRSK
jgi:hypothetical protein